ncbi:lasso RiPP family leader peptide-containing protein [Nonomuraea sp. NPDC003560]|uniref:lasso RiPP family leader peptide-containing protein n=1 Tax=Nonomuraea sp. NPDC003560 TaxID=3364341 RepID=UPI00368D6377
MRGDLTMHNQLTPPTDVYEPPLAEEVGGFADLTLGYPTPPNPESGDAFTYDWE